MAAAAPAGAGAGGGPGNGTGNAGNNGGMEVDGAGVSQVMAGGVTGSVSVALHPLVILNISDHWIRLRSQEGRNGQGTPGGREIPEICPETHPNGTESEESVSKSG
ncbi:hypothetical protein HGM15179_021586 [Zosterops borbonicus]|uniref:Uncharacterized protein n=1 Tax=Zosterops borbonicus TaxID=364589 RepID=A0A8K1D5K4_9PASS|nr:hypothetical protein HGM15179_021586 [Zosterops borbonicus]